MFILHLSHSLSAKPRACQANCGLFIEKKNRDLFLSHEAALCCDDTHISISCPLRAPKKHIHASTSRSICQTFHHCQTILSSPCGTWGVSPFGIGEKELGGSEKNSHAFTIHFCKTRRHYHNWSLSSHWSPLWGRCQLNTRYCQFLAGWWKKPTVAKSWPFSNSS